MISPHVTVGRRNLAAAAVHLMRRIGVNAFQVVLMPDRDPKEIASLNHESLNSPLLTAIDVQAELARVFATVHPVFEVESDRVHLAGELLDVMLAARRWNHDVAAPAGRKAWGRRTVRYFVFDPRLGHFAPSNFCAYLPVWRTPRGGPDFDGEMSVESYIGIEYTAPKFDGSVAWRHLVRNLAFHPIDVADDELLEAKFSRWADRHAETVTVHPRGARILLPPQWWS